MREQHASVCLVLSCLSCVRGVGLTHAKSFFIGVALETAMGLARRGGVAETDVRTPLHCTARTPAAVTWLAQTRAASFL